ncbi:DUF2059 domain-containing protein [Flavobacterium sp.]|uniref:DUF2059 domain-containing protein n=1 Tax=Flavobacterium sp. TaxID=239 RepID=UPI003526F38F
MKKVFLIFAFILVGQMGFSQEDFKADVLKMMKLSGANSAMDAAKGQILTMIPSEKQAEFLKEFDVIVNSISEKQADNYMEVYSHDDIKEMIKFYESPIGQKIQKNAPILAEKSMATQQTVGMELQGLVMKYMQ